MSQTTRKHIAHLLLTLFLAMVVMKEAHIVFDHSSHSHAHHHTDHDFDSQFEVSDDCVLCDYFFHSYTPLTKAPVWVIECNDCNIYSSYQSSFISQAYEGSLFLRGPPVV